MRNYNIDITVGLQVPAYSQHEAVLTVLDNMQGGRYDNLLHTGDGVKVSCVGEVGVTEGAK